MSQDNANGQDKGNQRFVDKVRARMKASDAELMLSGEAPQWMTDKEREERASIIADIKRRQLLEQAGGMMAVAAVDAVDRTTNAIWNIRAGVEDEERKEVVDDFAAGILGDYHTSVRTLNNQGLESLEARGTKKPFESPPSPPTKKGFWGRTPSE